jgi:alkylhydroperoxidase/carboxymuconolactone decarboxylase family protein YurZ
MYGNGGNRPMADYEEKFDPRGVEVFKEIFGKAFRPPFKRLDESTEAAGPRRIAQRALFGNDIIDVKTRALTIFTVMIAMGFKAEGKLYMQGLRNLGFSNREIAELLETIGLYAGVPRAVDGHMLLAELNAEDEERDHSKEFYNVLPGEHG